jgi:glycosyltransferase involved in cell wall biosynthesis
MTVLLVTNHVPPERVGAFAALHERVGIELALFGGRSTHATAGVADPGVPHRHVSQRGVYALAASGRYDAVIAGTAGRIALPAAYAGARRARRPFVLWTALWAPLTAPALLPSIPLLSHLYRHADAVVTYGEHVSAHVRARGARSVHIAPQAVDNAFWSAPTGPATAQGQTPFRVVFAGRPGRAKGLEVLVEAWRACRLADPAALVLVGVDRDDLPAHAGVAVQPVGPQPPEMVRNFFGDAAVVVIPSIPTPDFREPWGLVANEAMNQGVPIIATDAVGAAAAGRVRHERNGLVVPAGDVPALAAAITRLHDDPQLRARLGADARRDVAAFTFESFAGGFQSALAACADRPRKGYR